MPAYLNVCLCKKSCENSIPFAGLQGANVLLHVVDEKGDIVKVGLETIRSEAHAAGEKGGIEKCVARLQQLEGCTWEDYRTGVDDAIQSLKSLLPLDTNN